MCCPGDGPWHKSACHKIMGLKMAHGICYKSITFFPVYFHINYKRYTNNLNHEVLDTIPVIVTKFSEKTKSSPKHSHAE